MTERVPPNWGQGLAPGAVPLEEWLVTPRPASTVDRRLRAQQAVIALFEHEGYPNIAWMLRDQLVRLCDRLVDYGPPAADRRPG